MSKVKIAIKKIEKFIESLVDIQHNLETTGVITNEMKILFHYIDEYNEMVDNADNWFSSESYGNSPSGLCSNSDDSQLLPYDIDNCDAESVYAFGDDDYCLENGKLNSTDTSDQASDGSSDYMSDIEIDENDDTYTKYIENVMKKSGLEYKNYINNKLLSKKLISEEN